MNRTRFPLLTALFLAASPAWAGDPLSLEAAAKALPTRASPRKDYRERLIDQIEAGFHFPEGVSKEAREITPWVVHEMLREMPLDILSRVAECRPELLIVPTGKLPSAFPPFSNLAHAGKVRADYVHGAMAGFVTRRVDPYGRVLASIRDEAFRGLKKFPGAYVITHEWAHVVHFCALGLPREELVSDLYGLHSEADHRFPSEYSRKNEREYFAEATALWFGFWMSNEVMPDYVTTYAAMLRHSDPKMYFLLEALFGPPRDALR